MALNFINAAHILPSQSGALTDYIFEADFGKTTSSIITIGGTAQASGFSGVVEGIKILPLNAHYVTRITPRLEVYPYEAVVDTTDNTYDTAFVGSSFSMGSSNTIGDSGSTNLAIFGFNNTLKGDKMVVIGQANNISNANGTNVASLVVGTSNVVNSSGSSNGDLKNSLLVGQNIAVQRLVTRSVITGVGHSITTDTTNSFALGSTNEVFGNNNIIWGASNQGGNGSINNIMLGGFSNQLTSTTGNTYGAVVVGWNNTNKSNSNASFITGRNNTVVHNDHSIVGGFQNVVGNSSTTSVESNNLVVGINNEHTGSNSIITGSDNETNLNLSILCGQNHGEGTPSNLQGSSHIIGGDQHRMDNSGSQRNLLIGYNHDFRDANMQSNIVGGSTNIVNTSATGSFSNNLISGNNNNIGSSGFSTNNTLFTGQNNSATLGSQSTTNVSAALGRGNVINGTLAFAMGGSNAVYADGTGNCFAIGNRNQIGLSSASRNTAIALGVSNFLTGTYASQSIAIGKNLSEIDSYSDTHTVYLGEGNESANNNYNKTFLKISTVIGGSNTTGNRRDAALVTSRYSDNNQEYKSQIVLPQIGLNNNFPNDIDAAGGGVPLWGLYHTNGDLKIRKSISTTQYDSSTKNGNKSNACADSVDQTYYKTGSSTDFIIGQACFYDSLGNKPLPNGWYRVDNGSQVIQISTSGLISQRSVCSGSLIDFQASSNLVFNQICGFGANPTANQTYYHTGAGTFPIAGEYVYTNSSGTNFLANGYYFLYSAGSQNVYIRLINSTGQVNEQSTCTVPT